MIQIEEHWKDIKGYEGTYQVSNHGRIKSLSRTIVGRGGMLVNLPTRIINPYYAGLKDKYLMIGLSVGGKRKKFFVHRLVAEHFIGDIPEAMVINHIDENSKNNRVDNLEIVTQQVNIQKARDNNGIRKHVRTKIKVLDIETGEELIFDDSEKASEFVGITSASVRLHADGVWSGVSQDKYEISRIS